MKKLLSVLFAICLVVGLLPVIASAAGETAKVSIISNSDTGTYAALEVTEGGEAKHLLTEDNCARPELSASASNYNIKFEWKTGGKPTLTLNGAVLHSNLADKPCISFSNGADEYVLAIEEDSTVKKTGNGSEWGAIRMYRASLTITGPGKLTLDVSRCSGVQLYDDQYKTVGPNHDIVLDEANIEMTFHKDSNSDFCYGFGRHAGTMKVLGGTLKANINIGGLFYGDHPDSNFIISDSAKIELNGETEVGLVRVENSIIIESGDLKIRHAGTAAFYAGKVFKIKGGTIDSVGAPFSYSPDSVGIDFSEYEGDFTAIVCNSNDGKGAVQYDPEKQNIQSRYVYFKVTPGASYEVTVKNGTTDLSVAEAGATVTITARIAPEGKVFDKWEVNNGDITLADPAAMTTTFVMPKENVKVTATYKDDPTQVEDEPEASTPEASTPEESTPEVSTPDVSTPDESTPDASTPDTDNDEGNKKPATSNKGNGGFIALFIIMIVVLVLAIAAVVVFTIITMKKMGIQLFKAKAPAEAIEAAAEETEEATEETAEDAE